MANIVSHTSGTNDGSIVSPDTATDDDEEMRKKDEFAGHLTDEGKIR